MAAVHAPDAASLQEDGIRLAVITDRELPLPKTILPVEKQISEGTVFLTIRRRKGGVTV